MMTFHQPSRSTWMHLISKVMLLFYPIARPGELENKHYAPIRIQFVNVLVTTENITNLVSSITNKLRYIFHKSCPTESRVISFNNSPKCNIKIFLEYLTNDHTVVGT